MSVYHQLSLPSSQGQCDTSSCASSADPGTLASVRLGFDFPMLFRMALGSLLSGILRTWPAHLSCEDVTSASTLTDLDLFNTSTSGIVSCHLIHKIDRR